MLIFQIKRIISSDKWFNYLVFFFFEYGHPHKMFRFPCIALIPLVKVSRSVGQKKKKNEHMIAY